MTLCRFTIGQPTLRLVTTAPTIAQGVTMVEVEAAARGAVAQGTDEMAGEAAVNGDEESDYVCAFNLFVSSWLQLGESGQ